MDRTQRAEVSERPTVRLGRGRHTAGISRPAWHFIVDVILLVAISALTWASAVLQFVFPRPTRADGWTLWGWGYDAWSNLRFGLLCAFVAMVLLHVMLQWDWVCNFIASRLSRWRGKRVTIPKAIRTIYGVATLIMLLTGFCILLAIAEFTVRPAP